MNSFTSLCLILYSVLVFSQPSQPNEPKNGSIAGRVMDAGLQQPIPYANVIVKNQKDAIITGGITDAEGNFLIEKIPEGTIKIEITFIGYTTVTKEITLTGDTLHTNIGDIYLEESASALDEVTVVAEVSTIQQKIDRKVINIGKDLTTTGPTASDIMNNIPSVSVDQQSGAISLRGNQNVQIMVDGKLSNIPPEQLLKQIPSSSIKQIELITNPSAKYNPEGMSGMINIILHKNTNIGFNGNMNVGLSYQIEPKFNSSIDMNYRNGKLNFYGSYGNNISKNANNGIIRQTEVNSFQTFDFLDNNKSHLYKLGLDYYINDHHTVSFFTNQNLFDGLTFGENELIFENSSNLNQFQTFESDNDNTSSQYNFDYKFAIDDEGHSIELEIDQNIFDSDVQNDNLFFGMANRPNFLEFTDIERERTTINLDYVNPISESSKLELGLQAMLFDNRIDYNSDARVRDQTGNFIPTTTRFDYTRDIYSAYATFGKKLEKWSYQFGLRAETVTVDAFATETNLRDNSTLDIPFENDYIQLYPSAFVTYEASEKNSYQLSFSRRVDRPGVGQVNPIPQWNTPLVSQFGNQELRPQFTNSVEINYTRQMKKGSVTAGVFYRHIEDEINQAVFVDRSDLSSGRIILTNDNFNNTAAYGVEISSNYKPTKWWSLNGSFDLYTQTQSSFAESLDPTIPNPTVDDIELSQVEVDNVVYNFRIFNNFKLSKKLSLSAFGLYRSRNKGLQFTMDPMYFVNLGARYSFLEDNRATFSINFNNVFDTQEISIVGERPFRQTVNFFPEFKTIFVGLSYRFGGNKFRAKSRKQRDDNEKSGNGFI